MENKTPQNRRTTSASRFGSVTNNAPRRTAAPARTRVAGANAQSGRRPSGFAPAAPERRRTPAKPAAAKPAAARTVKRPEHQEPIRNKRTQRRRELPLWQKLLLIGVPALLVFIVVIVLIFGGDDGTYHQLPRVERGTSSAFEPEETSAPEGAGALDDLSAFAASEEPAAQDPDLDEAAIFDALAGSGNLDGFLDGAGDFADAGDLPDEGFFGDTDGFGDDADADDLLKQLIALEEAGA